MEGELPVFEKRGQSDLVERAAKGFADRISLATVLSQKATLDGTEANIFSAVGTVPLGSLTSLDDFKHRFSTIFATITTAPLHVQRSIISTLADQSEVGIVSTLAIGSFRNDDKVLLSQLHGLPDQELSIVLESYARFRGGNDILSEDTVETILKMSRDFITIVLQLFSHRPSSRRNPQESFGQSLTDSIARFRRRSLRFAGSDISSIFQQMSDPSFSPSVTELHTMRTLARDWGVDTEFDYLLVARAMRPDNAVRQFVQTEMSLLTAGRLQRERLAADLKYIIDPTGFQFVSVRQRPASRLHNLVLLAARLALALEKKRLPAIYQNIIEIFTFDRGLLKFIDWRLVTTLTRRSGDLSIESSFVTMLLGDPEVKKHHPKAALSIGKGALIADLTVLLKTGTPGGLNKLLAQVKTLPQKPARAMAEAILKRDIVERLAAALIRPVSAKTSSLFEGGSISILRIAALHDARTRGLLLEADVSAEINSEIQQLRYNYFQDRMRVGRVKVRWDELKASSKRIFDETVPVDFLKNAPAREVTDEIVPRLVEFIAEKVTSYVLHDSPVSIDHALSDNLRHGIVVPRLLKTFDDAIQTLGRKDLLAGWTEEEVKSVFERSGEGILRYREFVAEHIKAFVERELAVQPDGRLYSETKAGISNILDMHLRGGMARRRTRPETQVVKVTTKALKSALRNAAKLLTENVSRSLMAELRSVQRSLKKTANNNTKNFLDSLETNLHDAFEEVRQWIGVATDGGDGIPFSLYEIVQLELLRTQTSSIDKLRVKVDQQLTRSDGTVKKDFVIQGRYLSTFESVVHNLLSNAFTYSGAKLRTDVRLQLKIVSGKLLIRAENNIAESRLSDVIKEHPRTVTLARARASSDARRDHKSGFQKIRLALAQEFPGPVTINIPPPSEKNRIFVVEVSLDLQGEIWVDG